MLLSIDVDTILLFTPILTFIFMYNESFSHL